MDLDSVDIERLALNEPGKFEVEVREVGDKGYPLLVLDNLYRDPEYVRSIALSIDAQPSDSSHPGVSTKFKTDITGLHEIAWEYVGKRFNYDLQQAIARSVFPGFSFMRINRKPENLTIHQCQPHADPVRIAGVIYLNLEEHCKGGTGFYRHRATGVEECVLPRNPNEPFEQAYMKHAQEIGVFDSYRKYCQEKFQIPYMEFIRAVLTTFPREKNYPLDSNEDWELTQKVEMKFNRFICYPGFMIHSGYYRDEWFGESAQEQRLTQNVFIA